MEGLEINDVVVCLNAGLRHTRVNFFIISKTLAESGIKLAKEVKLSSVTDNYDFHKTDSYDVINTTFNYWLPGITSVNYFKSAAFII